MNIHGNLMIALASIKKEAEDKSHFYIVDSDGKRVIKHRSSIDEGVTRYGIFFVTLEMAIPLKLNATKIYRALIKMLSDSKIGSLECYISEEQSKQSFLRFEQISFASTDISNMLNALAPSVDMLKRALNQPTQRKVQSKGSEIKSYEWFCELIDDHKFSEAVKFAGDNLFDLIERMNFSHTSPKTQKHLKEFKTLLTKIISNGIA